MTPILELRGVDVRFGGNQVLSGVDLQVTPGFTGLIGPNGGGKTTVFNAVTGYVRPAAGQILVNGQPVPSGMVVSVAATIRSSLVRMRR